MGKRKWTDEDLIFHCQNSKNKTEVLKKLGLSYKNSGNYQTIDKYFTKLKINIVFTAVSTHKVFPALLIIKAHLIKR